MLLHAVLRPPYRLIVRAHSHTLFISYERTYQVRFFVARRKMYVSLTTQRRTKGKTFLATFSLPSLLGDKHQHEAIKPTQAHKT